MAKQEAVLIEDFLGPSTEFVPDYEIDTDLGNLLGCNAAHIDVKKFRSDREEFLLELTKGSTQILINSLNKLPFETSDQSVVKLPEPTTRLPREKVIPKEKQLTKWEQYAKLKGIQKKKKGRMVWDDESQQYRPRWGYKSKDDTKSWLLEVPQNADPMEDQFAKKKMEKSERIHKNEMQRLRNIARATKSKVPGVGLTPTVTQSKDQLSTALTVSHRSTASLGKFTETLPNERLKGKKRKFDSNNIGEDERERQRKVAKKITDSIPAVDVTEATRAVLHEQKRRENEDEEERRMKKKKSGKKGRGPKGGGGGKGNKSFGGKGNKSFGGKGNKSFGGKGKKSFGGKGQKAGSRKGGKKR